MTDIPYQFYTSTVNGQPTVQVSPGTNTPYGYSPTDFGGALNTLASQYQWSVNNIQDTIDRGVASNSATGALSAAQQTAQQYQDLVNRYTSGGLTDADYGLLSTQFGLTADQLRAMSGGGSVGSGIVTGPITATNSNGFYSTQTAADYASANPSTQTPYNPASPPQYTFPTGSAADMLNQGLQSGAVSATNPQQQFAASMTGNNTTSSGIAPVAPGSSYAPPASAQTYASIYPPATNQPVTTYSNNPTAQARDFYKVLGSNGQITVYQSNGTKVPDVGTFQGLGLNIDWIPFRQASGGASATGGSNPFTLGGGFPTGDLGNLTSSSFGGVNTGSFGFQQPVSPVPNGGIDLSRLGAPATPPPGTGGFQAPNFNTAPSTSTAASWQAPTQTNTGINPLLTSYGFGGTNTSSYSFNQLAANNQLGGNIQTYTIPDPNAEGGVRITAYVKPTAGDGREFGRVGNDIFEVNKDGTYRYVSSQEFPLLGLNATLLPDLANMKSAQTALNYAGQQANGWQGYAAGTGQSEYAYSPDQFANIVVSGTPNGTTSPLTGTSTPKVPSGNELSSTTHAQSIYSQAEMDAALAAAAKSYAQQSSGIDYASYVDPGFSTYDADIRALQTRLDTLQKNDPLGGKTLVQLQQSLLNGYGVTANKALLLQKQNDLAAVNLLYDNLSADIQNDPGYTQSIKSKNYDIIDNKRLASAKFLQSQVTALQDAIHNGETDAANVLDAYYKDYTIAHTQQQDIQTAIDKLRSYADKASDNSRAAINSLIANPDLAAGLTDSELNYIVKNGTFPISMIKRISTTITGKADALKEFKYADDGRVYAFDPAQNKIIQVGTWSGNPTAGGASGTNQSYQDIGGQKVLITTDKSGNILSKQIIGPAGTPSTTDLRSQFLNWLPSVKGTYSPDQLKSVVAAFLPGYDSTKDTALSSTIDGYSSQKTGSIFGIGGSYPAASTDPITAFSTYQGSATGTGGGTGGSLPKTMTLGGKTYTLGTDGLYHAN